MSQNVAQKKKNQKEKDMGREFDSGSFHNQFFDPK